MLKVLLASCAVLGLCMVDGVQAEDKGKLQHIVAFKFKDDVKAEKIKEVVDALKALKDKIPEIKGLEAGSNNSPEGKSKGFTHCFIITFDSEKGRDTYLKHKDHDEFVKLVGPTVADVFVFDFWTNEKK